MSEDRLEKALEAMKSEEAGPEELARAHDRVRQKLNISGDLCAEFQLQFQEYLGSRLDDSRRLLMEDHLSRCTVCRSKLAGLRGDGKIAVMPVRRKYLWPRWGTWAAAAALVLAALYLGRANIDSLLAQGPRATVVAVKGSLHLVPQGILKSGSTIGENSLVRTGPDSRAILRLADGSLVDVNERTELYIHAAWSGKVIHLQRGDVIVRAARQRHGYLRVQTRDSLASVKGTVFAVSTGMNGSLVSVIEGSVAVAQAGSEVLLRPGQQAASNPALALSAQQAVSWSPDAETYTGMLASLATIQKQLAAIPSPVLRMQSGLLQFVPANMFVYGAVPNLTTTINQAMLLANQQTAENPAFRQWWNSGAGQSLQQLVDRIQTVTPLLGNEIVYGYSAIAPMTAEKVPVILAEVQPGKRAELADALSKLGIYQEQSCAITDSLIILSDSQSHLRWVRDHLGQGANTPFAAEIAARYQDGVSWLLGLDMDSILAFSGMPQGFSGTQQLKHIILEQRPAGLGENEMTIAFKGPRMGLASFLANSGSGGAAEYLSSDVIAAAYASTREPRQMFDELAALIARSMPQFPGELARAEAALGVSFAGDFASAIGTESALGLDGISLSGPAWTLAVLVNDPSALEGFIRRLADGCNAEFAKSGQTQRITIEQETVNNRTWTTMKFSGAPITATWTYDRGYMVAASDRGGAMRAIANRNGGSSLIWSSAFQQQLTGPAGLHPSGFAWVNTKGALQGLAALVPNPAIQKLIAEPDPILVVFSASTEQIRAVSRTKISGLVMDLMLLRGLGQN
jgi:hypothetical protein